MQMEKEAVERIVRKLAPFVSDSILADALGVSKNKVRWIRRRLAFSSRST